MTSTISRDIDTGSLSRLWCAATIFTKYCGRRALEKYSSLCAKLIQNRDQLVKYLGFPLPELEIIYPFCAKGADRRSKSLLYPKIASVTVPPRPDIARFMGSVVPITLVVSGRGVPK